MGIDILVYILYYTKSYLSYFVTSLGRDVMVWMAACVVEMNTRETISVSVVMLPEFGNGNASEDSECLMSATGLAVFHARVYVKYRCFRFGDPEATPDEDVSGRVISISPYQV